jgi:hypothetical protein
VCISFFGLHLSLFKLCTHCTVPPRGSSSPLIFDILIRHCKSLQSLQLNQKYMGSGYQLWVGVHNFSESILAYVELFAKCFVFLTPIMDQPPSSNALAMLACFFCFCFLFLFLFFCLVAPVNHCSRSGSDGFRPQLYFSACSDSIRVYTPPRRTQ